MAGRILISAVALFASGSGHAQSPATPTSSPAVDARSDRTDANAGGPQLSGTIGAQGTARILRSVWGMLSESERATIQQRYVADLRDPSAYGLVLDNQGLDVSTPGTTGGAQLGSAVANAAYIDRAISPSHNYSAKTQLAVGILGAVIGSSLDKAPVQQYHYRYALKLHDGEIVYRDSLQSSPFRHPASMCLELASLSPAPQAMCSQTAIDVRRAFLGASPPTALIPAAQSVQSAPAAIAPTGSSDTFTVICKVGNLAPFQTTNEKCKSIGGVFL